MSALTKLARGRACQVRLPGICNFNAETTVLAHYRLAGICGVGFKPPDLIGAHCCSACHDAIDGRVPSGLSEDELNLAHAHGVFRTQVIVIKLGKLK